MEPPLAVTALGIECPASVLGFLPHRGWLSPFVSLATSVLLPEFLTFPESQWLFLNPLFTGLKE
jgi:hypothetical protein